MILRINKIFVILMGLFLIGSGSVLAKEYK
jgi:hypothetical protein